MASDLIEQMIQQFPYRCPYCDQTVSYESYDLKEGENLVHCPSCQKTYIKIVTKSVEIHSDK